MADYDFSLFPSKRPDPFAQRPKPDPFGRGGPVTTPEGPQPPREERGTPPEDLRAWDRKGWECPVCGSGNAPWLRQCPCKNGKGVKGS
jgi:hypothetical protein